jgi:hypothetical protein
MNSETRAAALRLANPSGLYNPAPHGYSHLAMVGPNTRLLLVSGQGGEDERGELASDFRQQVRRPFITSALRSPREALHSQTSPR